VSEGQGYGLLLAGIAFASLDSSSVKWEETGDLAYEMFLGWRRMCELSAGSGSCQDDEGFKCGGGSYPCLPHWKFGDDLTSVIGQGAAPDGDADSLAGMLLAVMAGRRANRQPAWLDEMGMWAYETCVQFYESSTISSPSGSHRIVKLGSCWGGWGNDGQNPSYHAPGVYRMCKHYMEDFDNEFGASSSEGDEYKSKWDTVIDTSYKMFRAVQCPSTGLITNWAKIFEAGEQLTASTGFSGSGTPGAQYGSEASRGVWRVALDYLLFPSEASSAAAPFLRLVTTQLETKESSGSWSDNLDIDETCLVESIHASWSWNMFMAGPTFSALVSPAGLSEGRQQQLADSAGVRVASKSIQDYYSGSWIVISTMTLNGDLSKAAFNAGLTSSVLTTTASTTTPFVDRTTTSTSTSSATPAPSPTPNVSPVPSPAPSPMPMPDPAPMPVPSQCSATGNDCRNTKCCSQAGYYCYEKDQYWASCRQSCTPGINPLDPPEYQSPWTCAPLDSALPAPTPTPTPVPSTTRSTTSTSTSSAPLKVFSAVNGGSDRVCRGATQNDNSNSYFNIVRVASLDACKEACEATSACVGIEFKGSRCEVWNREIQATKPVDGYTCLRYGKAVVERQGTFVPVDGGDGRACRGASRTDNLREYFQVLYLSSEESCQRSCKQLDICKGIEWSNGRCELWTRAEGIGATKPLTGFKCLRFVEVVEG